MQQQIFIKYGIALMNYCGCMRKLLKKRLNENNKNKEMYNIAIFLCAPL